MNLPLHCLRSSRLISAYTPRASFRRPILLTYQRPIFLSHKTNLQARPLSMSSPSAPSSSSPRALSPTSQNALAAHFASLHIPGTPLLLANAHDIPSAHAVLSHPRAQALATSSYGIAGTYGLADEDLSLTQLLSGFREIARVALPRGKPLTVDAQDGYGDVRGTVRGIVEVGAVGCNLEDAVSGETPRMKTVEEAVAAIREAKEAAREMGVPEFVVNARCDVLHFGGGLEDAVSRGKRYLEAGATTVFVWAGQKRGLRDDEVRRLVEELRGMVNVRMVLKEGYLGPKELAELGVARVSVGPDLYHLQVEALGKAVGMVLGSN
ncbi:MAG: hypothetical protein MMC23_000169 [Stictis urceolatum]|nr:hypothetical protein [Stictis urceolata]